MHDSAEVPRMALRPACLTLGAWLVGFAGPAIAQNYPRPPAYQAVDIPAMPARLCSEDEKTRLVLSFAIGTRLAAKSRPIISDGSSKIFVSFGSRSLFTAVGRCGAITSSAVLMFARISNAWPVNRGRSVAGTFSASGRKCANARAGASSVNGRPAPLIFDLAS